MRRGIVTMILICCICSSLLFAKSPIVLAVDNSIFVFPLATVSGRFETSVNGQQTKISRQIGAKINTVEKEESISAKESIPASVLPDAVPVEANDRVFGPGIIGNGYHIVFQIKNTLS